MVSTLPLVDILQQAASFCRLDAALEDAGCAALVELVVDHGVRLGASQHLSPITPSSHLSLKLVFVALRLVLRSHVESATHKQGSSNQTHQMPSYLPSPADVHVNQR